MKKVIGILAGMGPAASVLLFDTIVKLTDAKCDQDNIRIIVDNNTSIPDRTLFILGHGQDPRDQLIDSASRLKKAGANFLIMPCNTAHYFYKEIRETSDIDMLHLLRETMKFVKAKDIKKVGLLATSGTIDTDIYRIIGSEENIEVIIPDELYQDKIMKFIYDIKAGEEGELLDFYEVVANLESKGVDDFILGCTELSVANKKLNLHEKFIDPLIVISKVAIEFAGYKVKKED